MILPMKYAIILSILIFGSDLYGQTDSIEKASIYNKMASKEIEQEEFVRIWQNWNQKMKEIKQYPEFAFRSERKSSLFICQ